MSERLWYLKRCDLFQRLGQEQLSALEARCRIRKFPRSTPVYLPSDCADSVMLLAAGRVKIGSFTEEGKQAILAFIEPGELFGELSLLDSEQRDEYAETVEKSTVILISNEIMQKLLAENPEVSLGITKIFGLRRQRIERRLKYLLFRSNRERLVHLLIELAEQYGRACDEGVELRIKLSHQDLANIIGSTRETVTVVLGELQGEGRLKLGRRKIVLTDIARLADSISVGVPRLSGARTEDDRKTE
jgi:CRP/FNR family cyclic AMP-dependent transcriptional regulator